MTESKFKKLVVALTVGAILLLFLLCSFLVYQLVYINSEKRKSEELEAKIKEYTMLIERGEDTIETRSMRWWIERRARELGYTFDGDIDLSSFDK